MVNIYQIFYYLKKKGEMVFLNGVSKSELDNYWTPGTVKICDDNILAWDCLDGILLYKN
tara:strand:+ start:120 stop:296 length:177 start_codon:yes stop_codon:yes gene_type:complete